MVDRHGHHGGGGRRSGTDDDLATRGRRPLPSWGRFARLFAGKLLGDTALEITHELRTGFAGAGPRCPQLDRRADLRGFEVVGGEGFRSPAGEQIIDVFAYPAPGHGAPPSLI